VVACRHGHRKRALTATFGKTEIAVPRAGVVGEDGKTPKPHQVRRRFDRRR
jgi:hypothetical protein